MGAAGIPDAIQVADISIWHFVFTSAVWFAAALALYNAIIGVLGMNAVKPNAAKWPKWVWLLLVIGVLLSLTAAWLTADQLQETDHDKRVADGRFVGIKDQLKAVQDQQKSTTDELNGKLQAITGQNGKLQTALDSLGAKAHVSPGASFDDLVKGIADKLPKTSPVAIKGDHNITAVGGGQAAQQQTVNAAGGIGTIGGTLVNPQVTNYAPPPAILTYKEEVQTPLTSKTDKVLQVRVSTDRKIPGAAIGLIFSDPFDESKQYWQAHQPDITGGAANAVTVKIPIAGNGVPIPNSLGAVVDLPAALMPGTDLVVTVTSKADIHVLQVVQVGP